MNFACQQEAVAQLQDMAAHNVHSILLEGVAGAGKTYLARQYARLLEVSDFQVVDPSVGGVLHYFEVSGGADVTCVYCSYLSKYEAGA